MADAGAVMHAGRPELCLMTRSVSGGNEDSNSELRDDDQTYV